VNEVVWAAFSEHSIRVQPPFWNGVEGISRRFKLTTCLHSTECFGLILKVGIGDVAQIKLPAPRCEMLPNGQLIGEFLRRNGPQ